MDKLPSGFFGIIGLFIGSFLNVCIYRMPRKESLAWPGSHCPSCGRFIGPLELVPVLSWISLRGKCKTCGAKISARYPLVELMTGICFWWSARHAAGHIPEFAADVLFLSGMIIVFFVDLEHWIIPDRVVFPLSAAGLGLAWSRGMLLDSVEAAVIGFAVFYAIALLGSLLLKKEAMGGGDIKLAGMIGCYLGIKLMLAGFFLAFLLGTLISVPLLVMGRRKTSDPVPFGPMMAAGAAMSLIAGPGLLDWYGDIMARMWLH